MMFSTIKPLPLNVKYQNGESATSLASRLARRNGVSGMAMFLSDFGIDYLKLSNGDQEDCARLASLAGVDQAELHRHTPALVSPGWFRLGMEEIKFTAFSRTALKGCPQCLQDASNQNDAAHFGIWQLTSIRTCCLHGCYLTPLPTSSGTRERFDVIKLTSGFSPPEPQIANDQDLLFEHYLRTRIEKGPGKTWLDRLPFHVAAQTCEGFGLLLTLGPKARRETVTPRNGRLQALPVMVSYVTDQMLSGKSSRRSSGRIRSTTPFTGPAIACSSSGCATATTTLSSM